MEYIGNFIAEHLSVRLTYVLIIVFIFYVVITKLPDIFDSIERLRYGKVRSLKEAIESGYFDDKSIESFQIALRRSYFKKITGLEVGHDERELIIQLHILSNGNLSYEDIKEVKPFINFDIATKKYLIKNNYRYKNGYSLSTSIAYILFGLIFLVLFFFNFKNFSSIPLTEQSFVEITFPTLVSIVCAIAGLFAGFGSLNNNNNIELAQCFIKRQQELLDSD